MHIIEPATPEEFAQYYKLRYQTLRQPWNQPEGSERADDDDSAIHAMLVNEQNEAVGVCRLHMQTPTQGQLRFMGLHQGYRNKGLGNLLINYLEQRAKDLGATHMLLQAREPALPFYQRCGYTITAKTYLLFNEIQHYQMEKQL